MRPLIHLRDVWKVPHVADYAERIVTFRDGRIVSDVLQAPSRQATEALRA